MNRQLVMNLIYGLPTSASHRVSVKPISSSLFRRMITCIFLTEAHSD